jgi:hypothetical protein
MENENKVLLEAYENTLKSRYVRKKEMQDITSNNKIPNG